MSKASTWLKIYTTTLFVLSYASNSYAHTTSYDHLAQPNKYKIALVLNQHIEVINHCIQSSYRNQRTYFYYNNKLDHKVLTNQGVSKFSSFFAKEISLPTTQYEAAKKLQVDIPIAQRESFATLFDSLWQMMQTQNSVCLELRNLTKNQPHITDSLVLNSVYQHLDRLDLIVHDYGELSNQFETLANRIYMANTTPSVDAWTRSAQSLKTALDTARLYLNKTRAGEYDSTHPLDTTQLSIMLSQLEAQRSTNTGGIRDLGSQNGNSAPSRYDNIIRHLRRLMNAYYGSKKVTNYSPDAYENIVIEFNRAIDHYNSFAQISAMHDMNIPPAYLLKIVKEQGLYHATRIKSPKPNNSNNMLSMQGFAFNHMVLLLDVSGSMNHPTKLPLIQDAIKELSTAMRENDRLSVVIYSDDASAVLTNVSFTDQEALQTLFTLNSKGKTNAIKGIRLAYQLAHTQFIPEGNNRIILATDGDFEISKETHQLIKSGTKDGIVLTVFGFGKQISDEKQLQKLAKEGQGNYKQVRKNNRMSVMIDELTAVKMETKNKD